jgi:hypothetical protein
MAERHVIAGPPRGEPLPAGHVGARVRVPLSGTPSSAWAEAFTAALSTRLTGHRGVSHLRLAHAVQGGELVLEGVQLADASHLGSAVRAAIGAANAGRERAERGPEADNMEQEEADRIAAALDLTDDRDVIELDKPPPTRKTPRRTGVIPPGA